MRLTVVGSGDAFAAGGRANTCFHLAWAGATILVDCGASTLIEMRRCGLDPGALDGVILSHLHGDHFGGLPFLFLEAQWVSRRTKPFTIVGPPGTQARLETLIEALYPGALAVPRRYDFRVIEIVPGEPADLFGARLQTAEVEHPSGAPSTAIRLEAAGKTFAYSGDTQWTDALYPIARGADLFVIECYAAKAGVPWHIDWETLRSRRGSLEARQVMVTHMGPTALPLTEAIRAAGCLVADDGLVLDL
jgi:ribonuclease BN (tRNA processing enzyme)